MHRSHGTGKEPVSDHFGDGGVFGDGLSSSRADVGVHSAVKEKPRERPIVIQVPQKRKGPNSKSQEPGPLEIELHASATEGQGNKQLILLDIQPILMKGDMEIQKKQ
jgi:hypothetical protein